jgi:DNA-binding MarR family transcriptional regulator
MHDAPRLGNLLGAASLAVSDLVLTQVREAGGVSVSGASALVVLAHAPGLSVTELGRHVGLSQPAAARMVESLEVAGLARRGAGQGRTVAVVLTAKGRSAVAGVLAARAEALADLLAGFGQADRELLGRLLEALLTQLYTEVGSAEYLCRLCDRGGCTTSSVCPVGQAERDHLGT